MISLARPLLALFALCSPSLPRPQELDHAALAADFRARHAVEGIADEALGLDDVLEHHYASGELGMFEVHLPIDQLGEGDGLEAMVDGLRGLVDVQEVWLDAFAASGDAKAAADALKQLRKWLDRIDEYRPDGDAPDLILALGGDERTVAASAHLRELFSADGALAFTPVAAKRPRIVLSATRRDFVESACFFGQLLESIKHLYWHQGVATWTEFWWEDIQVVALVYASPPGSGDPWRGYPMNKRERTGISEHVAQRGAVGLAWYCFGEGLPPAVELGLAQILVVDAYEENNVRSGGSTRGSVTNGTTAFIPGGNPGGGVLPAVSAESSWREDKGSDYFTKPLRDAQRSGSKHAEGAQGSGGKWRKLAWFQLVGDGGRGQTWVGAPFLGDQVLGKTTPEPEFMSDYLEFFRAYKTNFLYWLRIAALGRGKEQATRKSFRDLFAKVAAGGGTASFEALAEETYGVPLSAADGEADSLEWRYLEWLSKQ